MTLLVNLFSQPTARAPPTPLRGRNPSRGRRRRSLSCKRSKSREKKQQVVLNESLRLRAQDIRQTQLWINSTFSNGNSLRQTAYELYVKDMGIVALPKIRVARHPMSEQYYCCDNRRLFIYRTLDLTIDCQEVNWTTEFQNKLNQKTYQEDYDNDERWCTDPSGLQQFREEFIEFLKSKADSRGNMVYVPRASVGFLLGRQYLTKRRMQYKYGVQITVAKHKYEADTFDVVPIFVNPHPKARLEKVSAALRNMKKMVNKVRTRDNETTFFPDTS